MGDFCAKLMSIRPADEIIEVEGIVNLTGLGKQWDKNEKHIYSHFI